MNDLKHKSNNDNQNFPVNSLVSLLQKYVLMNFVLKLRKNS